MLDMLASFVNSSDGFQDCWVPFLTSFDRYGSVLREGPVYLNTERIAYDWPGINLKATCTWPVSETKRPSWSECFIRGLHQIREPYVLYLQEDYFLKQAVDDAYIAGALDAIRRDESVGVIYLNQYGPQFKQSQRYSDSLVEILPPSRYLVCTQAAIWRKDFLLSLIRSWENGWMFEIFGSLRSRHARHKFLSIQPEIMRRSPVFDYIYTGVIKGKWKEECESFFKQNGILVDLSKRGIYQQRGRTKSRLEVAWKLCAYPTGFLRSLASVVRA